MRQTERLTGSRLADSLRVVLRKLCAQELRDQIGRNLTMRKYLRSIDLAVAQFKLALRIRPSTALSEKEQKALSLLDLLIKS